LGLVQDSPFGHISHIAAAGWRSNVSGDGDQGEILPLRHSPRSISKMLLQEQ
jgi:hypothetical protein